MKAKIFIVTILFLLLGKYSADAQTVRIPANLTVAKATQFYEDATSIFPSMLPIYIDNQHVLPSTKGTYSFEHYGFNLDGFPKVIHDDFRYDQKFINQHGEYGFGYLSPLYILPSNGNYILTLCYLDPTGEDYYRFFLATFDLSGKFIDYKLVEDGWYESYSSKTTFTQARLEKDLTLRVAEIRMYGSSYVSRGDIKTFQGQKVETVYKLSTDGHFMKWSETASAKRSYNISELCGPLGITVPSQSSSDGGGGTTGFKDPTQNGKIRILEPESFPRE